MHASTTTRTRLRPQRAIWILLLVLLATAWAFLQPPHPHPDITRKPGTWEWWAYPLERNPGLHLPALPGTLRAVSFVDESHGWAVGYGGIIFSTRDGGQNWHVQSSGTTADLFAVQFLPDGKGGVKGWAAGTQGCVLISNGRDWQKIPAFSNANWRGMHIHQDGQKLWLVADNGDIFQSTDAGQNWQSMHLNGITSRAIHFDPQAKHGIVLGRHAIFFTQDGGKQWQLSQVEDGVSVDLLAGQLDIDGKHAWAVGVSGQILASNDGGKSWHKEVSHTTANLFALQIQPDAIWVIGGGGSLLRRMNNTQQWQQMEPSTTSTLYSMTFHTKSKNAWLVGDSGVVLRSNDAGRNWLQLSAGPSAVIYGFAMHDQQLWLTGAKGLILTSSDGGQNWLEQDSGTENWINNIRMAPNGKNGIALTNTVLFTSDSGAHWRTTQNNATLPPFYDLHWHVDSMQVWAAGLNGAIYHSKDGGANWIAQATGENYYDFRTIRFDSNGQYGIAAGSGGRIIISQNGGKTWEKSSSGTTNYLLGLNLSGNGETSWAVGNNDTMLRSTDGGKTWMKQFFGSATTLTSIQFHPDGRRGWVVGDGGKHWYTVNGGLSWQEADNQQASRRFEIAMDAKGEIGWSVGLPPALLKTTDGGKTWTPQPFPLRYARYPAPWYWTLLLISSLLLWRALRPQPDTSLSGAASLAATDAPTTEFSQDKLQFAPLARGISRFLRNTQTEPPLTLAISGDWGSGKSSLMGLVCSDLKRYGYRPVWFNAWHHQNEEHLLAALLETVRKQALPPLTQADGWLFRWRLLCLRSMKHALGVLLLAAMAAAGLGWLGTHDPAQWRNLAQALGQASSKLSANKTPDSAASKSASAPPAASAPAIPNPPAPPGAPGAESPNGSDLSAAPGALAALLALGSALYALIRALKAFGVNPAVLLASTAANFKLKDASAQTGFRSKFAEQFDEVTQALPTRMVIVIDDLDRCKPESVLLVMEAVNFLVSSGQCFVIFGMATQRVLAGLALAFEKIAKELPELDQALPDNPSASQKEQAERAKRHAYARDYLEKLINIEIQVPTRTDLAAQQLLNTPEAGGPESMRSMLQNLRRYAPLGLAGLMVYGAFFAGAWLKSPPPAPPQPMVQALAPPADSPPAPASAAASSSNNSSAKPSASASASAPAETAPRYLPAVQPGDDHPTSPLLLTLGLGGFLALLGGIMLYRVRSSMRQVQDSAEFSAALGIWLPVVTQKRATPRSVKRFGNRIRYLVMLQQGEEVDHSLLDELEQRWRRWSGRASADSSNASGNGPDPAARHALAEHHLVAMGAMHEAFGEQWHDYLDSAARSLEIAAGSTSYSEKEIDLIATIGAAQSQCIAAGTWPPSDLEIAAFERSLKGVRVRS